MDALHDMHCHLDFMTNGEEVASRAQADGTFIFANTVTPEGAILARERFAPFGNVAVGFGMHPWWVAGEPSREQGAQRRDMSQRAARRQETTVASQDRELTSAERERQAAVIDVLEQANPILIGEVGLDFGWRHLATRAAQLAMFEAIARWSADRGRKLLSIHSIKAAKETLDILERTGALGSCACVFHWFSGSSDLLKRAIDAGCYFSCGPRMLETGKGREYLKAIPTAQLLLETDAPPQAGEGYPYEELQRNLDTIAKGVAAAKGEDALKTIAQTSLRLLGSRES